MFLIQDMVETLGDGDDEDEDEDLEEEDEAAPKKVIRLDLYIKQYQLGSAAVDITIDAIHYVGCNRQEETSLTPHQKHLVQKRQQKLRKQVGALAQYSIFMSMHGHVRAPYGCMLTGLHLL